jgi:SAM-dependent methyltransferase
MLRKIYNKYIDLTIFNYFHFLMRKYLKRYSNSISGEVLDIGCGNKPYKDLFNNVTSYTGTNSEDYYSSSLYFPDKTDIIVNDGCELPIEDNRFDAVLNFQVLPVFHETEAFFVEVRRVLKPNGYFLLSTDFLYPIWNAPHNYYRHTEFGIKYLAEKSGFKIISCEPMGGYWAMQARLLERFFRTQLSNFIKDLKKTKPNGKKILMLFRLLFWLIIVLVSPILINLFILLFHFFDKIIYDPDFTTNYIFLMKKS